MRFLVDAQLPYRLVRWLQQQGHEALHTLELPEANRTTDLRLKQISTREQRTIITKDTDFVDNLLLHGNIYRLLLVTTGNISNEQLLHLFKQHLDIIIRHLEHHTFIELSRTLVIVHE